MSPQIVHLAMFAMVVSGGVETAVADTIYSFTTIDGPVGYDTNAHGINNSGQIVGGFSSLGASIHGFLYTGGSFTILDSPREGAAIFNEAHGINNSGQIVGVGSLRGNFDGYLYTGGSFTTIDVPGNQNTWAQGINDSGQIVGYFNIGPTQSFVYTGGNFTTFNVPVSGATYTQANGINNSGQIVGSFTDATGNLHGFVDTGGIFTTIDIPGANHYTVASGINNSGQIVGSFTDATGNVHGFVDTGGRFTTFDVPGTTITQALGINDSGQIVGFFVDATGGEHGFLATPTPGLEFYPVTPCRVMDTRNANGPLGGPFIAGGSTRPIPIPSSACNIPANAAAYSLNVTAVPREGSLGYLAVWPTGLSQPLVSTLNSPDGLVIANAAIVPAGTNGSINAYVTDDADLVIDINGYFVPPATGTLQFYPLTPCRILDTRYPTGTFGGPSITGGTSRSFPIPSSTCNMPTTAAAYSLNLTVVPQGPLGYLTTWPTGQAQPVVSTLNSEDGTVLANAAIVPAGTNGAVSFYASNTTDLVADINGYFAPPGTGGLNFYAVTPCRIVDTRNANGTFGGPLMNGNSIRTFPLSQGPCGLPTTAAAYALNMTVVPSGPLGYLTTWPTGGTQPLVSTLNAVEGQVIANAAIVPAGTNGAVDVFVTNTTHVIIDTNGYFGQ